MIIPAALSAGIRNGIEYGLMQAYAEGFAVLESKKEFDYDLAEVARIWQVGCIIRAKFLGRIKDAYKRDPNLKSLLLDEEFASRINEAQTNWRRVIGLATEAGIPTLAMSASLGYFDMYRSAALPLNLTQAQRDFFGSHTYERIDKPELGFIHTDWE